MPQPGVHRRLHDAPGSGAIFSDIATPGAASPPRSSVGLRPATLFATVLKRLCALFTMGAMDDDQFREQFDTGVKKIRHELRSLLAQHGLFGTITDADSGLADGVPDSSTVAIQVKGRTTARSFDRRQIEGCHLRVGGTVLSSIIAMVDEVSGPPPPERS
jgi:hypothetical protein